MHGKTEALFALLEFALRPAPGIAVIGFAQRALDRRHQPRSAFLENIIDGALLQRLDGALLADRAGDEDEGRVGTARFGDLQRVGAVETRQSVIGQDEIRRESGERFFVIGARIHPAADDVQALYAYFAEP